MIEIPSDTQYDFSTPVNARTVMLLAPPRFIARRLSTPNELNEPMQAIALTILSKCYKDVRKRWTEIRDHLDRMLDEGDALFSPRITIDCSGMTKYSLDRESISGQSTG
jgi:hypothetical protein